mgnify:CR=1 FL=1
MKTNKSYTKRIKVTKKGKVIARKPGQDHFNAKESRVTRLGRKQTKNVTMTNKAKARFLDK